MKNLWSCGKEKSKQWYDLHLCDYKYIQGQCPVCGNSGDIETFKHNENDERFHQSGYFQCMCGRIIYEEEKSPAYKELKYQNKYNAILEEYYKNNSINLKEVDEQYKDNGLISINDEMTIEKTNIPQVYDKRIEAYIRLDDNITFELLNLCNDLRVKGTIGSLAVLPDEYYCVCEKEWYLRLMEAKEQGKYFAFENLRVSKELVTKLYDYEYRDFLWIKTDGKQMTFEEMIDDTTNTTQVVHLRYTFDRDNKPYIEHIDHEFIFYTDEEFEKKKCDSHIKGKQKQKTIKIDNAKIPFVLENNQDFLCMFLDTFFERKDYLVEYFQNVLK